MRKLKKKLNSIKKQEYLNTPTIRLVFFKFQMVYSISSIKIPFFSTLGNKAEFNDKKGFTGVKEVSHSNSARLSDPLNPLNSALFPLQPATHPKYKYKTFKQKSTFILHIHTVSKIRCGSLFTTLSVTVSSASSKSKYSLYYI